MVQEKHLFLFSVIYFFAALTFTPLALSESVQINADQATVQNCVNQYLQPLVNIAVYFSRTVINCGTSADTDTSDFTKADRSTITQQAQSVCDDFNYCNAEPTSADFYLCYSSIAPTALNTLYNITYTAEILADMQFEGLTADKQKQAVCITLAERSYVLNTHQVFESVNSCVQNATGIPTLAPVTVSTTSTTSNSQSTTNLPLTTTHSAQPNSATKMATAFGANIWNALQSLRVF